MGKPKFIVVGGGLAGLMAASKIAESGFNVDIFSLVPVRRSHSACAQGGINACKDTKGENDSVWEHFDDTIYGGDFLAHQPPVKRMCEAAPGIIDLYDRMGVMFNRTPEGLLDLRLFGGVKKRRTAFAGATTGQQLLNACDERIRSLEDKGLVKKYEFWQFLSIVKDDNGVCRGIIATDLKSMKIHSFRADAVILATGGFGRLYYRSTTSTICNGSPTAAVYLQGATLANMEFIQIHPTALPGEDKNRLMSESARGEGGRIWTYKDGKPWYFLEEMYPAYGNLVPRDIASREIFKVCTEMKLGIDGENLVYLDLTHKDPDELQKKLRGILEIYQKFTGFDPKKVPMKIFPSVHYSMGGIWVDYDHRTTIPGLFAAGECDYQYHGANRLGANSLLSATHSGMHVGPIAVDYVKNLKNLSEELPESIYTPFLNREEQMQEKLLKTTGDQTPASMHKELGKWMTDNVSVVRYNNKIKETYEHISEMIEDFYKKIYVPDKSKWTNQDLTYARELYNLLFLGQAVCLAALSRNESRGSHYKPEFPERNDEEFLCTTKINFVNGKPVIDYSEKIDTQYIKPRKRDYSVGKKVEG